MRIIAGKFRSRKIKRPLAGHIRPTKDRVREAVFSMIALYMEDREVLDLFAGSGAFAFEALSRGARRAHMVDSSPQSVRIMLENARDLGVEEYVRVEKNDVFRSLTRLAGRARRFDMIFADPPYGRGYGRKTLNMVSRYDILKPAGGLIIEHNAAECLPGRLGGVTLYKQKTYGDTIVSFFRIR